jgi:hypothetical protein
MFAASCRCDTRLANLAMFTQHFLIELCTVLLNPERKSSVIAAGIHSILKSLQDQFKPPDATHRHFPASGSLCITANELFSQ